MFKSVFTKFIAIFMAIILLSFLILTGIITSLVDSYALTLKERTLERAADSMALFLENAYTYANAKSLSKFNESGHLNEMVPMIDILSSNVDDLVIVIIDPDGNPLLMGQNASQYVVSEKNIIDGLETEISKTVPYYVINRLNAGYEVSMTDSLNGFFNDNYLTVCVPVYDSNNNVIGGVVTCSVSHSMDDLLNSMIKIVIMSSLWVLLAALVAVYFLSEKIISPLKEMNRAAKSFADGQFDVRVSVRGKDEVAELATAFNNMAGSLATQEEMRQTFLSNVSHELRTPMTTIAGFIDSILHGAIPPEKQDYYLGVIATEVRRLSRLVTSLLDISRMQAGERKFNKTVFDICELARLILISFEQKIDGKKLNVIFECDEEKMTVFADKDAIHQILYNLCDNAVKFSKRGGILRISLKNKDKKIHVSVYNEGQGIQPEDLPYVFDRFYKSDKSRGLDKTGVGLGLYISKTIMSALNEKIWVESDYGYNCNFTFTLTRVHE